MVDGAIAGLLAHLRAGDDRPHDFVRRERDRRAGVIARPETPPERQTENDSRTEDPIGPAIPGPGNDTRTGKLSSCRGTRSPS